MGGVVPCCCSSESTKLELSEMRVEQEALKTHAKFILDNVGNLEENYIMQKRRLGAGSFGKVFAATHRLTGESRAIKVISKKKIIEGVIEKDCSKKIAMFKMEIAIAKALDHPHIAKLFETYEDSRMCYLVMELCSGGELLDGVIREQDFTEKHAAILMDQIIRAIFHMHEQKVCHRDVKPQNLLFLTDDPIEANFVKLIDFGMACRFEPSEVLTATCGSPNYVAPEVLDGCYDNSCDLWSCGVIMYQLLSGHLPFTGKTDKQVLDNVRSASIAMDSPVWKDVSDDAKHLLRGLLQREPMQRYRADQALSHPWIEGHAPNAVAAHHSLFMHNLESFSSASKLKKAALHAIAYEMKEEQIKALRETFMAFDSNSDGQLTLKEVKEGIHKAGLEEITVDLERILEEVDANGSGAIDYTELLAAGLDKRAYLKEDVCWSAFRKFDRNGDQTISPQELRQVLGDESLQELLGKQEVSKMLKEIDANGDGAISFDEFVAHMSA